MKRFHLRFFQLIFIFMVVAGEQQHFSASQNPGRKAGSDQQKNIPKMSPRWATASATLLVLLLRFVQTALTQ